MGTPAQVNRYFTDFGLSNLFSFQADRKTYADDCANCQSQFGDGLEKRQGYQAKAHGQGGYGMVEYDYTDFTGNVVNEILTIDKNGLYRLSTGTLSITYSGSHPRATASVQVVAGQYKLILYDGNTNVLTTSLGQGFEESSTITLAALATTISSVSGFAASVSGDSSVAAAFLDITPELSLVPGTAGAIHYLYYSAVNSFTTMEGLSSIVGTDNVSNVTLVPYNGYVVVADGGTLKVYDGDSLYLAGLPKPTIYSATNVPGQYTDTFNYFTTYQYYDFQGNLSESAFSDPINVTATGFDGSSIVLTFSSLTSASGYNTRYGIVNGVQSVDPIGGKVTLTVASGHSLVAGSYAYFYNSDAGVADYADYTISSVTSTTIVLESDVPISVTNELLISANLRINIYRQSESSTIRYQIGAVPNDPRTNMICWEDTSRTCTVEGGPAYPVLEGTLVEIVSPALNQLLVGDVVTIPPGTTDLDGIALPASTTFTVISINDVFIVISALDGLIIPYAGPGFSPKFIISPLTFPNFIGNLDPSAGTVPRRDTPPDNITTCAAFNAQLVISSGQIVYWSDTTEPLISNSGLQFDVVSYKDRFSHPITAMKQSGQSCIFFQASRIDKYTCSDLIFDTIVRGLISDRIGCVGSSAFTQAGSRLFFLHQTGVYEINNGTLTLNKPVYTYGSLGVSANRAATTQDTLAASTGLGGAISEDVIGYFYGFQPFVWKRAVLGYEIYNNQLWIYLPIEEPGLYGWAGVQSILLMYETRNDRWYKWTNINIAGGMCQDVYYNLYFCERRRGKSLRININKLTRRWDNYAYYDHTQAIYFLYQTKYDILNQTVANNKKILKELKIYSIPTLSTDYLHTPTLSVTIYKDYVGVQHSTLSYTFPAQGNTWPFTWNALPMQSWRPPYESLFPQTEGVESYALRIENNEAGINSKITGWALQWQPKVSNVRE